MSLQKLLQSCDYETMSYSGRGMYGKKCLAIDFDGNNIMMVAADAFEKFMLYPDAEERFDLGSDELCEAFRNVSYDSLGRGMVVYFPEIPFDAAECEDNDSDDDEDEDDEE